MYYTIHVQNIFWVWILQPLSCINFSKAFNFLLCLFSYLSLAFPLYYCKSKMLLSCLHFHLSDGMLSWFELSMLIYNSLQKVLGAHIVICVILYLLCHASPKVADVIKSVEAGLCLRSSNSSFLLLAARPFEASAYAMSKLWRIQ